jgi:hypothetical protein
MKKCSRSRYNLLHHRLPRRLRQQRESVRLRLPALGRERTARGENPYHVPRAMSSNAPQARADHTIVNECSSSPRRQYRLLSSPCQRTQRDGPDIAQAPMRTIRRGLACRDGQWPRKWEGMRTRTKLQRSPPRGDSSRPRWFSCSDSEAVSPSYQRRLPPRFTFGTESPILREASRTHRRGIGS